MRKIAVSLTKGGVGKTTTAVNVAAGIALSGYRVLLVDADSQGHAGFMLGIEPNQGLAELITGDAGPTAAVVEARERLWLLAGGKSLASVQSTIAQKDHGRERVLAEALELVDGHYDYVIVDTPPSWDTMIVNVLFYVNEILAPGSLEILTLKGLAEFSANLAAMSKYKEISLNYVVPTFLDGRVKKSGEVLELLKAYYGPQLCSPIRYNVRLSEAAGHGQTIYEYAPQSPGAEDYRKVVERLVSDGGT